MAFTREQVCKSTSAKLAAAAVEKRISSMNVVVGLDGFVDEIVVVVDKRHADDHYDAIGTIEQFSDRIADAAGNSSNFELVVKQQKLGGNGPIMANALAAMGFVTSYIGNLGYPKIHPVFADFAGRVNVMSVAEPAHTDALEFADGKLMLGKMLPLNEVNWENLLARVGREKLLQTFSQSRVIGMTNWTMLPHMSDIWTKLLEEVFPRIPRAERRMFVDLADPQKRTRKDLLEAMELLTKFQEHAEVTLGLNLKESIQIAEVLGVGRLENTEEFAGENARDIREKLKLACVVIHPRRCAAAASETEVARFDGPFVHHPRISTGAGDHFNAGFSLGQALGMTLEESLCIGCGASGCYVRTGESPDANQLSEFIGAMPPPQ